MRNYHEAENDWETVQKQYTWLVETLLDCLKNHTSFVLFLFELDSHYQSQ